MAHGKVCYIEIPATDIERSSKFYASVALNEIVAQGGEIVQPIGGDAPEITARFRDPGGNVLGLYQLPSG